jgi:multidrug efflux pump subunit AcrA (membrane-fusion protein)
MSGNRLFVLLCVVAFMTLLAAGSWIAGSRIESPADAAARTAPPPPSPILVPVEQRVLSSNVVTRGTARFGLPQPVSVAPSLLKPTPGLITTLPRRNAQFAEGDVILTASGRPVFVLVGDAPAYRDLVPGISGKDVVQLEQGLARLGFDPGPVDGSYDRRTSAAVKAWYASTGWEPFGPTLDQLVRVRDLERSLGEAQKLELAAAAELEARLADQHRLMGNGDGKAPRAVELERAKANYAEMAAEAEIAAKVAERALIVLDPRQPETARAAAEARLELARAAARDAKLQAELAIQAAERDARLAGNQLEVARMDAKLAAEFTERVASDLQTARRKLGIQVPVDEIVFFPALPVRVEEVMAVVGDPARGTVMSVTDNTTSIDAALALDVAPLVRPDMQVRIDEPALGIRATGTVKYVADTPGTRGVDGYHIYCEVAVDPTPTPIEGFSLRLTIPIESTDSAVIVVPISALSLAADGTSRIQVQRDGALEYRVVEPGLSADGYVEVTPPEGSLEPGQLAVVGYENPEDAALKRARASPPRPGAYWNSRRCAGSSARTRPCMRWWTSTFGCSAATGCRSPVRRAPASRRC